MNFDFIGKRKFAYALSIIVIIAGIVSLFVQGLNFGVDFTGGTVYQIQFEDEKDIADLRSELGDHGLRRRADPRAPERRLPDPHRFHGPERPGRFHQPAHRRCWQL